MATLSATKLRSFEQGVAPQLNDLPVIAADRIYEGAALGDAGPGNIRPLEAADAFVGFAYAEADNTTGSAGDVNVRVRQKGIVQIPVTGVTGVTDLGVSVYASDDDTFTLTAAGNSIIGKVVRFISGTDVMVAFEGIQVRSV